VKYIIQITKGQDKGKKYPVEEARTTLGRKPGNSITFPDIKVSGVHAEIVFEQGRPVVRDLGSTNGTWLEGRKIDEVVLSEGDKITLGDVEFLFLAEGAETPAPGQESQGMDEVRVIHDVRPVRRGMGGLILLIILLLGLGGAGYYWFAYVKTEGSSKPLETRRGNLLASGWSFEGSTRGKGLAEAWSQESQNGSSFRAIKRQARSGAYAFKASMQDGGHARAAYTKLLNVNPRRCYTASAWVMVSGNAMLALKASFLKGGEDADSVEHLLTDEFASGREEGLDYIKIEGTVFPPPEAKKMEFKIVAAGKGEVVVDDVELFEKSSAEPSQVGTSGVMDFFSCDEGFQVRRISSTLFMGGRILANVASGEDGINVYDSSSAGFGSKDGGYLYCGPDLGLVRAGRTLEVNAEKIQGTCTLPALPGGTVQATRYCFDLMEEFAKHGLGVLTGEEFSLFDGAFPVQTANALLFGGSHDRVKIDFERPVQVVGEDLKTGGVSVQCLFKPGEPVNFCFNIQSDFTEEARQAQSMVQQANKAEQGKRYSEALNLIEQITKRYPYNDAVMDRAEELRSSILEIKRKTLSDIQDRLRSAKFLNTPERFTSLEGICQNALQRFPEDKDIEGALQEVREKSGALLKEIRDEQAERFYLIAKNLYEAQDRETTLREIVAYMQKQYPESEWTAKVLNLGKQDNPGTESNQESGDNG